MSKAITQTQHQHTNDNDPSRNNTSSSTRSTAPTDDDDAGGSRSTGSGRRGLDEKSGGFIGGLRSAFTSSVLSLKLFRAPSMGSVVVMYDLNLVVSDM